MSDHCLPQPQKIVMPDQSDLALSHLTPPNLTVLGLVRPPGGARSRPRIAYCRGIPLALILALVRRARMVTGARVGVIRGQ